MYKTKTVFIVGAGASLEIGMPTSDSLKSHIARALDIKYEHFNTQISGSRRISEALFSHFRTENGINVPEIKKHITAARRIVDAIQQAISIDSFIENIEDELVTFMAKLAISEIIIDAERNSKLFPKCNNNITYINWDNIGDTWLHYFFQTIIEGTKASNLDNLFDNISIISFNYDRSIEFFLEGALKTILVFPKKFP